MLSRNPRGGRGDDSRHKQRGAEENDFDPVLEKYLEKDISVMENQGFMQSEKCIKSLCSLTGEPLR